MMQNWITAIRPKTLFASLSPVLLGLALSFHYQRNLHILIATLTLLCAVGLQISSNLANDYLDFLRWIDNELRMGPLRATQAKLISPKEMKRALIFSLGLSFIMGIYLMAVGGWPIIIVGMLALYFAYGYTGGPFPLSYNALGEISAFIFFGLIAVCGTFFLQTKTLNLHTVFLGISAGSIAATILAINNLRDMKSDSLTHKKTIALIFGELFQRRLSLLLISTSVLMIIINALILKNPLALFPLFIPYFFRSHWFYLYSGAVNETLNLTLAKTAQYFFMYSFTVSLTIVFL